MAGLKGRSGRKSRFEEAKSGDLLSLCSAWLVDNFHTFDKETKLRVALIIAPRGIQQKVEHSGEIKLDLANKLESARNRMANVSSN